MKKVLLIGIGAGNPDYITMQAIKAINTVDVFFFLDKDEAKEDLAELRRRSASVSSRTIRTGSSRFQDRFAT